MTLSPFRSWLPRLATGAAVVLLLAHFTATPRLVAQTTSRTVTVNPAVPRQVMRGWEVLGEAEIHRPDFPAFQKAALDKVVQAGFNRVRLEVRSGVENTIDAYADWGAAGFPQGQQYPAFMTWRAKRYETINDNTDPNVINWAGFHFTELDDVVNTLINPLRARLAARGEALYVNLDYVVGLPQVTSGAYYVHQDPAEYAEYALAAFLHLQQRYGWVPDSMEMVLEPDNNLPIWTPTLVGKVIAATGARLAANGFHPDIVAPSTVCMNAAITYFDGIVAVPNALPYLKELSYHRYCNADAATLQTIATRAINAGVATSMLEWWDQHNTFLTLHEDLKVGRNSAWQQGAIVDLQNNKGVGTVSYLDPAVPTVANFTNPTQYFRRYFEFVRMGAVRVAASSDSADLDPLAFRNPTGAFTVVVKATAAGNVTVAGLPPGTYGIDYTASAINDPEEPTLIGSQPDQTIGSGQALSTSIPAWGVITVHARAVANCNGACITVSPPAPPAPVQGSVQGRSVSLQWLAPVTGGEVTGYVLDAGLSPGATVASLPLGLRTSVTLSDVPSNHYWLRVRATGPGGTSVPSAEVALTVGACSATPRAPRAVRAAVNGPIVSLAWLDDDGCEGRRYGLLVGSQPGTANLGTAAIDTTGFSGPVPPGRYYVRAVTQTAAGVSAPSNEVAFTAGGVCHAPDVVLALGASQTAGVLTLQWTPPDPAIVDASDAVTPLGYVIEAGSAAGRSDLGVVPVGRTTIVRAPVPTGRYVVRVRAVNACGPGPASNEVSVNMP